MMSSPPRPVLQLAAVLSGGSALVCVVAFLVALVATPWSKVVDASTVNDGMTITGIFVGATAGAGLLIAAPIAASYETWKAHRRALAFSAVQCGASVAGILLGQWFAVIPTALGGAAFILLVAPRSRSAMRAATGAERRWSASLGYVLLVSGGLWGLHNIYLRRSWAAVLSIGLLIFGAGTWGGLASYF
jgi:hypothetical protein